jgi:mRNA interferase RelE/StbE
MRYFVMKEIVVTAAATRQLAKLPADVRRRIVIKLRGYAETGSGDVKKLAGRAGARLRIGDYRAIFVEDKARITLVAVGHRREIYD